VEDHREDERVLGREGLIRNIEYESKADVAYDTALDNACSCGWGYVRVAIEYDRTGSPLSVWMSTATTGGGWARQMLTASAPIVLAIGMQSQAGQAWVSTPTEDNPGASWQSPFARWLLIDPRNGSARVIEAGSCKGALDANTARGLSLSPVFEEFQNSRPGG
jgi:hypothetical protein